MSTFENSRGPGTPGRRLPAGGTPQRPSPEDVFDHLRREDGEHVGYIEMVDDAFVPYDLLWVRRGEPMELDEAEATLDAVGLRLLAEDWLLLEGAPAGPGLDAAGRVARPTPTWSRVRIRELHRDRVVVARAVDDLSADVAKTISLVDAIELPLPTARLRPTGH